MGDSRLGVALDKMAKTNIDVMKKDWVVCTGCFCTNMYFTGFGMEQWCLERTTFLCLDSSFSGLPKREEDPKTCAICLPGLVVYPKVACCPMIKDVLEAEELAKVDPAKHEHILCGGCCLGDFMAGMTTCHKPSMEPLVICKSESIRFPLCCLAEDCVFPCDNTVPMTLTGNVTSLPLCFCTLYPQVGCCKKVSELYPEQDWTVAPGESSALLQNGGTEEVPADTKPLEGGEPKTEA